MNKTKVKYICPCCGYLTLDDKPGSFDICPVCYWEDDNIQRNDPNYKGGANGISLIEARENYKKMGAISAEYIDIVRLPLEEEIPIDKIENVEWTADFINDPHSDSKLVIELLYNGEDIGVIKPGKHGLELILFDHRKNITIPCDWLLGLMNKANNEFKKA
jgi:hypothetical protein